MSALTNYRHQIQAGDIPIILNSLQSYFVNVEIPLPPSSWQNEWKIKCTGTFIIPMQPIYARC